MMGLVVVASCADVATDADHAPQGLSVALADDDARAPIEWVACPDGFISECAWVATPIDHANPNAGSIPIFVAHHPAPSGNATAQLWLLQGGPGGSGDGFTPLLRRLLPDVLPQVDFFVLEHRGVGESARLQCPDYEQPKSDGGPSITRDEMPACLQALQAQWGDGLDQFRTSADADDLASLIERTREPGKKVYVYGVSYGTMRAMRFLQKHPDAVDGVILDSVVSPGVEFLSRFDEQYDPVAKALAEECAADEVCGAKLGADPWARLTELVSKLERGHCPDFLHRSLVRTGFSRLLMDSELRAHIFPLVYRIDRCTRADVQVVEHYFATMQQQELARQVRVPRESTLLQNHIILSELWEEPAPSLEDMQAREASLVISPELVPEVARVYDLWPRYEHDEYTNRWPSSKSVPILAMNGTLDPQTPIEIAMVAAQQLNGPQQHFVTVPFSSHLVLLSSPLKGSRDTCGAQLVKGFIDDATAAPNVACLENLKPVFDLDPAIASNYFGKPDVWENETPGPATPTTPPPTAASLQPFRVSPIGFGP